MDKIYCTDLLLNLYDNKSWEDVINDFQRKINCNLQKVPFHERDDLEQEIKLKIIEKMNFLKEIHAPGFWEFIYYQCEADSYCN